MDCDKEILNFICKMFADPAINMNFSAQSIEKYKNSTNLFIPDCLERKVGFFWIRNEVSKEIIGYIYQRIRCKSDLEKDHPINALLADNDREINSFGAFLIDGFRNQGIMKSKCSTWLCDIDNKYLNHFSHEKENKIMISFCEKHLKHIGWENIGEYGGEIHYAFQL